MKETITRTGAFSIASSAYTLFFLAILNAANTSQYPWVLFCIPAFFIWPLAVCKPRIMGNIPFAFVLSSGVIAYYSALNLFLAPGHPWVIYIIFAVAWYPFSMTMAKRGALALSLFGLIWSILFFGTVNRITSPHTVWAVYPIFAVLWWPLSVYFFAAKREDAK